MSEECSLDCLVGATEAVAERGKRVQIMIRILPVGNPSQYGLPAGQMSGWLFMTGDEDEGQSGIYSLRDVVDHDPSIVGYLDRPAPCSLERDEFGDGFHEVDVFDDEDLDDFQDDEPGQL